MRRKFIGKIVCTSFFAMFALISHAQEIKTDSLTITAPSKLSENVEPEISFEEKIDQILLFIAEHTRSEDYFKLYPTNNIWTFLKLDTRTGQIWQVQFDVEGDSRFQATVNSIDLTYGLNTKAGRFELYQTQNTYNFMLLDKVTGRMWQAQWSTKKDNRGLFPIF